ncbi:MAG: cysteine peptidase family C39 domain-containing protein [Verrucomicrobiota bacterium]
MANKHDHLIAYLATLTFLVSLAFFTGWRLGRRGSGQSVHLSRRASGTVIGLGLVWFVGAWLARRYADTDSAGSSLAEWFAYAGQWLVLLVATGFGSGFIFGAKQMPTSPWKRTLYFATVIGIAGLVVGRTMPIYFLLGDGRRDADHFVRQSAEYEYTCGAVALLNYLEQFCGSKNLTEREVSKICGVTTAGTTTTALVRAAHHFGLGNASARVLNGRELEAQKLPVIVSISTLPQVRHATLLIRLDDKSASFIDPAYGSWKISRERFQQIWYGKTVLLN